MNHYERLKVTQDAPPEVIRAAYRALANRLHPDHRAGHGGVGDVAHEQMAALNAAYEVLIDPTLRRDYDDSLSTARAWQTRGPDDVDPQERTATAGVTPADLIAPVTVWAPDLRQMVLIGVACLAVAVVGAALYLRGDSSAPPIEAAMSGQLGRQGGASSVDASRRPTVEELSRMSDEELVAAMPALDGPAVAAGRTSANKATLGVHPLDGPSLSLKSDRELLGSYSPGSTPPKP